VGREKTPVRAKARCPPSLEKIGKRGTVVEGGEKRETERSKKNGIFKGRMKNRGLVIVDAR